MCVVTADGIPNDSSDSEMEDKTTANLAALKLDEWLNFKLEPEVSCFLIGHIFFVININ